MDISINRLCLAVALAMSGVASSSHAQAPADPGQFDFFERKIRPVLVANCYECHSANSKKIKGGLRLDTREGMLQGGDSGPAIVPKDLKKSLLIVGIRHEGTNPHMAMPPKAPKLADAVVADFELWVKMGAPDPRSGKAVAKSTPWDTTKAGDHWAFKKIANPPVPKVDGKHVVQNPIDNFVIAKLSEKKLAPSPRADKHTLIRRVTYDLTGLPSTPEEVDAFLADMSSNAFEKVVDRLLASPQYGERWGRHWLDIARYADTSGDRRRVVYPHAWTYRDYVIDAFNKDLPYDRFIIEQIAADRLPETQQDKMRLAALGFLTVGKRFMGNVNDILDDRIDVVTRGLMGLTGACARCHDHKFDPISTQDYYALHGIFNSSEEPRNLAPLFDPKTNPDHADYLAEVAKIDQEAMRYSEGEAARVVSGMLQDAGNYMLGAHEWMRGPGAAKKGGGTSYFGIRAYLKTKKRGLQLELAYPWYVRMEALEAGKKNDPVFGPWLKFAALPPDKFRERAPDLLKEIAAADINPAIAQGLAAKNPVSLKEVVAVYTDVFSALHSQIKPERWHANAKLPFDIKPTQRVVADASLKALRKHLYGAHSPILPDDAIMTRSQYLFSKNKAAIYSKVLSLDLTHPGAPVKAMALVDKATPKNSPVFIRGEPDNLGPVAPRQFLTVLSGKDQKPFSDGSGRLELAQAIVSRDNPLTARVMVNRAWQWHFGQPIVRTVSDFGTRSEPPTHPELLDWLATWFMDNGWSLKKLHKLMVTSATYQQQSLAKERGIELDASNQWLWRFNMRRLDFEEVRDTLLFLSRSLDLSMGGPPFSLGALGPNMGKPKYFGADFSGMKINSPHRRTVYALIDRSGLPDVFNTFDFADPDMSTGERILTTVPQQALFMMNSPFVAEQVRNLLARPDFPAKAEGDDKVRFIFRVAFQRAPREKELDLARQFLNAASKTPLQRESGNVLNPWERYTQVLMLTNELLFLN